MYILLTNDDGTAGAGLGTLARTLRDRHTIVVVAPDREQSGVSHAITVREPLRVREVSLGDGIAAYAVNGTPADCVKLAFETLLKKTPDVVISGINDGANIGTDVLYSGTVAAALEGALAGVKSMAVSLDGRDPAGYRLAAKVTERLATRLSESSLSPGVVLNVNVPNVSAEELKGLKVTRLGVRKYQDVFHRRKDPRGGEYYWLAGTPFDLDDESVDVDAGAVKAGYVSVTPIHYDLTKHDAMDVVAGWDVWLEGDVPLEAT